MINAFTLIFVVISIFAFFELFIQKRMNNLVYWILVFFIIVIFSIRDYSIGAGGDTEVYVEVYNEIGKLSFQQMMQFGWEPGYILLNKIIYIVCDGNERCFVVLMEVFIMLPIAWYMRRISPMPNFCLLFFVALGGIIHTGLFRQMLAFSIILYGLKYLDCKNCSKCLNFIKFLIVILLASSFHVTALLFLAVYFVKLKLSVRSLLICFVISFVVYLFGYLIYSVLIKMSRIDYEMVSDGGLNKSVFMYFIAVLGVLLSRKAINKSYDIDVRLFMVAVALQPFCLVFGLASRFLIYFELSTAVIISVLLNEILTRVIAIRVAMLVNALVICLMYGMFISSKYQQYLIF